MKRWVWVIALVAVLVLASCGDDGAEQASGAADSGSDVGLDAAPDAEGDANTGDDDVPSSEPDEPSDLGRLCGIGCNLQTCVSETDDCGGGVCVWDQRLGFSYCSRLCARACAEGYRCAPTEDEAGPACLSDAPVCGNATLEAGEVCDDGNVEAGDFCAPNCSEETVPPSGGTVTQTLYDWEPTVSTGDDPQVVAQRIGERLFLSTSGSSVSYGIALPDGAGPAPFEASADVGLSENGCGLQTSTQASITRLDWERREIEGAASGVMRCTFGCEFGCASEIPFRVEFDVRWVDE